MKLIYRADMSTLTRIPGRDVFNMLASLLTERDVCPALRPAQAAKAGLASTGQTAPVPTLVIHNQPVGFMSNFNRYSH